MAGHIRHNWQRKRAFGRQDIPLILTIIIGVVPSFSAGVRVSVSDQGPGIPEEFREHIFSKFSQADGTDTRQRGGTGLGLNITRAIIEKLDGQISFETQAGKGATFHIDLPLHVELARAVEM